MLGAAACNRGPCAPSTSYVAPHRCPALPGGRPHQARRDRRASPRPRHERTSRCRSSGSGGGGSGRGPPPGDADDPRPNLPAISAEQLERLKRWAGFSTADTRVSPDVDDSGSSKRAGAPQPERTQWVDWTGADQEDWDEWRGPSVADLGDQDEVAELKEEVIELRRRRRGQRRTVRDEYLRPIVDMQGIYNRLNPNEAETEQRVFVESITNQYESRVAVQYLGVLIGVPLVAGFVVSRLIAGPLWSWAEGMDAGAFALKDEQKVAGAQKLHAEELRIRMEAAMGLAPPLSDEGMMEHLRHEAHELEAECIEENRSALLNVVSDSVSAALLFVLLLRRVPQRAILFRTAGRIFVGLSDTAKAFLIILVTDTLLGYHSEEGWTTALHLTSRHYGLEAEGESIHLFVAIVPVCLDTWFKYWIFVGLNKEDPAAAVTLRQMDRH